MGRARLIFWIAVGAMNAIAACSSNAPGGGKPIGMGDHLIVDVDATPAAEAPADDASGDSAFAPVGNGSAYRDSGTLVVSVCGPPEAGTGEAGAAKDADVDGGAAGADDGGASGGLYGGGSGSSSCTAFPSSCASQPYCNCVAAAFSAQLPCYWSCTFVMGTFRLYCP